ncbi:MAG: UDP-N-acetylglucosamine 4,6-dehydratase (inverting) [bacterium]
MDWQNQTVLVTGGTGSFGKKFIEILLNEYHPKKIIIFSRDELKQHEMRQTFSDGTGSTIRYFIGDIRDKDRLNRAFHGVDIVVHTAALKQVPACEYNPFEAVLTNVIGSKNIIDAAIDQGVTKVLALSTDKAVNPINLYGATKLCAEKLFVNGNAYSASERGPFFSCTRYGNVVGSRGSVIPAFSEQKKHGQITITDPRMTRFWITLDQGVHFVIKSIEEMHGGEIFIPKIPSMNIMDLAKAIAPECKTETIGIRPGEKIHEVLISSDEAYQTREFGDKYIILPVHPWWREKNWSEGKSVPEEFSYVSNTNDQWLSLDELRKMVRECE